MRNPESPLGGSLRALKLLEENGPLAKSHVARSLGITLPTALGHFRKLRDEKLVMATSKQSYSGPGRPLELWDINRTSNCTVGFAIAPPTLVLGLANFQDDLLLHETFDLSETASAEEILAIMERFLLGAVRHCQDKKITLRSVMGCLPGTLPWSHGHAVNMPQLDAVDIRGMIYKACGVNAELSGLSVAMSLGEAEDFEPDTMACLIRWELGIAVVPFYSRRVLFFDKLPPQNFMGLHDYAHMPIQKNGQNDRLCACGRRGCLEAYAGGRAIIKELQRDDIHLPADLVQLAQAGDQQVIEHLNHAAHLLGKAMSWYVLLMGIEQIRFTGPLSVVMSTYEDSFCQGLREFLPDEQVKGLKPQASADPVRRLLIGACRAARHSFVNG